MSVNSCHVRHSHLRLHWAYLLAWAPLDHDDLIVLALRLLVLQGDATLALHPHSLGLDA
jgi:hypothetical protein